MKNKCFCLTFSTFWGLPQQPFYYVRIRKYAKLKFREADKCDITVLLYRKPLIFGFKWGTKGTFSPYAKSRNTMCSPCASELRLRSLFFFWKSALLLSLNLLLFPFLESVLLLWVTLPPVKKAFPAARFLRWQSYFLQRLGLSFIDHHNILAVTAVSFFCILPEKIRSPAWTAVRRIFHHRNRSLLLSHKCSWR